MKIDPQQIPIRDLVKDYVNNDEEGVYAWGRKLNVRPPYQRELRYIDKLEWKRDAVIETILEDIEEDVPSSLGLFLWAINPKEALVDKIVAYCEMWDGQQRTISICEFVTNKFAVKDKTGERQIFDGLSPEVQKKFLDYEIEVRIWVDNDEDERLRQIKKRNSSGEAMNDQEIRNAAYVGPWVIDMRRRFAKTKCPAYSEYNKYLDGVPIQQDLLETVLDWISNGDIEKYMALHRFDKDGIIEWNYVVDVFKWVKKVFPKYRAPMKKFPWGKWYNKYKDKKFNPQEIEKTISRLIDDEEVECSVQDIYLFILTDNEKHLNLRSFSEKQKIKAYQKQKGCCAHCKKHFKFSEMEGDHVCRWRDGGKTDDDNCQMLCVGCNRDGRPKKKQERYIPVENKEFDVDFNLETANE
jgi:hypothetical protein